MMTQLQKDMSQFAVKDHPIVLKGLTWNDDVSIFVNPLHVGLRKQKSTMTEEEAQLVMKALGSFHASSYLYLEENKTSLDPIFTVRILFVILNNLDT